MSESNTQTAVRADDWITRRRAIIELSHARDPVLYKTFIKSLTDPVSEVRHAAIIALERLGDKRAVVLLAKPKFIQSPDMNIRLATVKALGRLGDIRVIDFIIPLVDDEEWLVRNEAVSVLQDKVHEIVQLGDPSLARILIRMLGIDESGIVLMASKGLIEMHEAIRHLLLDALKSVKEPVRYHVAHILGEARDKEAVPALVQTLKDESPLVRSQVALALGKIADKSAIPALIAALYDFNDTVRTAIMQALVLIGPESVAPLHMELSYSSNNLVITSILEALGVLGDPSSMNVLIERLNDSYYYVRLTAVKALIKMGEQVVPEILKKIDVKEVDISHLLKTAGEADGVSIRVRAIKALGDLEDAAALGTLKMLVNDVSIDVALAAQEALVRVGCAAWGRCGALMILGKVGDEKVIPRIVPLLKDESPHVRYEAIHALELLKAKEVLPELEKIAKSDPVHEIRSLALQRMREISPGSPTLFETGLNLIHDPAAAVRLEATRILGDYSEARAIEPLIKNLSDPSWNVRINAENAVCNYGRRLSKHLLALLPGTRVEGRCRVISALARIGEEAAIKPLEKIADDEKEPQKIRKIAQDALALLKKETGRQVLQAGDSLC
ncbi:HEAT repeat domain-containing protein [candidate division KSB1 bacterium]|nr:HEAT repeat domain-containing protein [candidate division KSB1 bacterium]